MKQVPEIIQDLRKKVKEHELELEFTLEEQEKIKKNISKLKEKNKGPQELMQLSSKLMVLKDKAMFHKAAILTLNNVLEDIK